MSSAPHVPTLADLAAAAGVARSTASMCISGKGTISQSTRERVRRVAREIGYVPDPLLGAIASTRLRRRSEQRFLPVASIGLDSSASWSRKFTGESQPSGKERGLDLFHWTVSDENDLVRLLRELYHRGVVGICLSRELATIHRRLPDSLFDPFAVLAIEEDEFEARFHVIRRSRCLDYRRLIIEAVKRGYQRPGLLVLVHEGRQFANDFMRIGVATMEQSSEGYVHEKTGHGIPQPLILRFGEDDVTEKIHAWLGKQEPDCVLATLPWCKQPLDAIGFRGGFACEVLPEDSSMQLTGLYLSAKVLGAQAMLQMDTLIRSRSHGVPEYPFVMSLPRKWRQGNTLPVVETR